MGLLLVLVVVVRSQDSGLGDLDVMTETVLKENKLILNEGFDE